MTTRYVGIWDDRWRGHPHAATFAREPGGGADRRESKALYHLLPAIVPPMERH